MGAPDDPGRAPRRGCCCLLFITEDTGTHPRSYIRADCFTHRRIARENYLGD
jgi:hypothetical protein